MKTALQQNIEKINSFIDYVEKSNSTTQMAKDFLIIFNNIKENAIGLLGTEKNQILEAHLDGQYCNVHGEESLNLSNHYFKNTFSNE